MVHRQSPLFINIYLHELVDNDKLHTNDIMRQTANLDNDDRCIFIRLYVIQGKAPLINKKMMTKVQLLHELIKLKIKVKLMPNDLAIDCMVANL